MTASPDVYPGQTTDFLDSSDLIGNPTALRERADEHGYLFFRGLLPADAVEDLRRRFLEILDRHGWLDREHDLMAGVADPDAYNNTPAEDIEFCGVGVTPAIYAEVQRLRQFHELAHYPRLLAVYRDLFGAEVFPHPRNIARLMVSGDRSRPTPPHQDFIHIQGTPNVWTAWFPLGDCSRDLGGLTVLDRSHHDGVLSYKRAAGAGGLEAYLCELDLMWAEGDFRAGDVLTFSSHTVHRALPNQHPELVRLSCDFRYQPRHEEINDASLRVHCNLMSWEEVYADWPDGGIQWYWRDIDFRYSPWDEEVRWQKDKIC